MTQPPDPSLAVAGGPDTHVAPLLPATALPPEPARTINFFKALLLYWLLPKRYGPHLAVGSWTRAMTAQVLSVLVFAAAFLPAITSEIHRSGSLGLREEAAQFVLGMARHTARSSFEWIPVLLVLGCVPLAELALVLLAILIMPWYAGGDRAGSVFKRSLKSVFWSTTILIPMAVPVCLMTAFQPDSRTNHLLAKYDDWVLAGVVLLAFGLPVVLLARMLLAGGTRYVGAADGPAFAPREPRCDDCGYLIIGLPLAARCPECGLQVRESLPGGRRRPTVWQENELKPSGFADLLRLQWAVFTRKDFFERLPVQSGLSSARHFWWGTWCLMLLATLAGLRLLASVAGDASDMLGMLMSGTIAIIVVPLLLQAMMMFIVCLCGQVRYGIRDYRVSAVACYYASPRMWPLAPLPIVMPLLMRPETSRWMRQSELLRFLALYTGRVDGIEIVIGLTLLGILLLWVTATLLFWWLYLGRALRDIQHANV